MILLRLISWPYARKHLVRWVLTIGGIVLGVALLVGMYTANQSVLEAFNRTVEHIAGKTQLQVSAGDGGFPEEVLERVQSDPNVRAAAPVIEQVVDSGLQGQGKLLILAVDMTGDRSLRDYDLEGGDEDVMDDPLVFLAQPDSLILTRDFAARNGLASGSKLAMKTMDGDKQFTVRGILRSGGMTSAFGGNLAIMDIYAAQKVFGTGRRFDRIDIGLKEGVALEQGQASLRKLLGPGFDVDPPSGRGQHFESLMSVYAMTMNVASLFALFIGMFIIYNSFAIAVTQRRAEIGILRALGATRGQIRALFLGESAIAGLAGSAVGIGFGLLMAQGLTASTNAFMEGVMGASANADHMLVRPWLLVAAAAMGVVTCMIAAFLPARNAARVDPVTALQKGQYQVLSAGENRRRRAAALAAIAVAAGCIIFGRSQAAFFTGYFLAVLAMLLLTPALSLYLSKLLRGPLKWLRPVEGALAADSLIQSPRRTSATVAALMLSLALVIALGGMARASYTEITQWMNITMNPDFFVTPSETISARTYHFPDSMADGLRQIPGIAEVQPVRVVRINFRGKPVMLVAIDSLAIARRTRGQRVTAGDFDGMYRAAAAQKGLIIADNLAQLEKLKLGEMLEIASPAGVLRLPISGILEDFSNQLGTIFIERALYRRLWKDDAVDVFRIYLAPGAVGADVKARVLDRFASERRLFVLSNKEVHTWVLKVTDQWFGMTYLQLFVAVLVAILGIVNTLTVSITDRRRELGVLRAVGGLRNQIRHTIWMEALAIGMIGLMLGVAAGAVNLYYQLTIVRQSFAGIALDYTFPFGIVALLIPVILGAAFGSALFPAETAVRSSLVEALEYE
ncbi:MAG TPA: FtsX-like permease family protein [Bryobacteraceae bacterium]|jgi:putative ABC transport system permease protein|nr:FtsX-like permease family protein [Bryobacteraceae bacterium]